MSVLLLLQLNIDRPKEELTQIWKRLIVDTVSENRMYTKVTVSVRYFLYADTVSVNNFLYADTVSVNNFLYADTVSVNNLFLLKI